VQYNYPDGSFAGNAGLTYNPNSGEEIPELILETNGLDAPLRVFSAGWPVEVDSFDVDGAVFAYEYGPLGVSISVVEEDDIGSGASPEALEIRDSLTGSNISGGTAFGVAVEVGSESISGQSGGLVGESISVQDTSADGTLGNINGEIIQIAGSSSSSNLYDLELAQITAAAQPSGIAASLYIPCSNCPLDDGAVPSAFAILIDGGPVSIGAASGGSLLVDNTDSTGAANFNSDYEDDIGGTTLYGTNVSSVLTGSDAAGDTLAAFTVKAESFPFSGATGPTNITAIAVNAFDYSTYGVPGNLYGIDLGLTYAGVVNGDLAAIYIEPLASLPGDGLAAAILIADPTAAGEDPDAWAINAPLGQNLLATAEFDQPTPTVASGDVGIGNTTTANTSCGTLALSSGCLQINVGGLMHYIPYY
jgi:hypothetical protein